MSSPEVLSSVTPELRERLRRSFSIAVFTGAGLSVASGIPAFRGPNQMKYFEGYPPAYICSTEMLEQSPTICWRFFHYLYELTTRAEPNAAHRALVAWQREAARRRVVKFYMVTTNFDGLLSRAGGNVVHELHGKINRARCRSCGKMYSMTEIRFEIDAPCCSCGCLLQPGITLLNDFVVEEAYNECTTATRGCEVFFIIGVSGVLKHSAYFTHLVKTRPGALLIEVNIRPSYLTKHMHFVLRGPAEEILPQFDYGSIEN